MTAESTEVRHMHTEFHTLKIKSHIRFAWGFLQDGPVSKVTKQLEGEKNKRILYLCLCVGL